MISKCTGNLIKSYRILSLFFIPPKYGNAKAKLVKALRRPRTRSYLTDPLANLLHIELNGVKRMRDILTEVRRAFRKKVLFTSHALDQMNLPDRMISTRDVYDAIENDEIVEDYPNDPRGHSCLIMGKTSGEQLIHLVCAPMRDYLTIITAYVPSLLEWRPDLKTRKRE